MVFKFSKRAMKQIYMTPGIPEIRYVFDKYNHNTKIVGGTVRDLLLRQPGVDIDLATTATTCEMTEMFTKEKIYHFHKSNGSNPHTVTASINDKFYDCTTLRFDKFANDKQISHPLKDWELDANIRDFTVNSLYLDFDGTLYDYCNGIDHIKKGHIQFVGNPTDRMQEDFLRILRYFRFFGKISASKNHSEHDIDCIKENAQGLEEIAGPRIFGELKKIVVGRWSPEMITKMKECGIFKYIGLTGDYDINSFVNEYNNCIQSDTPQPLDPLRMLAAGFTNMEDVAAFCMRTNCSKKDKYCLFDMVENRVSNKTDKLFRVQKEEIN